MNSCEKIQIAKLNLKPCRGRSVEYFTRVALQRMRAERNNDSMPFALVDAENRKIEYGTVGNLRKARFEQLRAKALHGVNMIVCDRKTMIQIL